ncbi:MAG: LTA synthase family protein, partial [Lactobacillus crispatus]|nr:LTA synthase family protein [Lactobacillus crispatus]
MLKEHYMEKKKIISFIQTRTGFLTLLVVCFWLKYIFAAYFDFNLGLSDPYQHFIMWLSPVGSAIILISFGFYIPKPLI